MLSTKQLRWREFWPEASQMMFEHHLERGFKEVDFHVDPINLQALELAGQLLLVGGFAEGELSGYLFWHLGQHISASKVRVASMGPSYVKPTWRSQGLFLEMLQTSIKILRPSVQVLRLVLAEQTDGWTEKAWLMELRRPLEGDLLCQ